MNALRRRLFKLATLLGALTIFWACNAPFIPVPPPGASFESQLVDDGMGNQKTVWIAHGLPSMNAANATYYIYNERMQDGIIATAGPDGTFTGMPMDGMMNDRIDLSYRTPAGDYSDSLCVLLTAGPAGVSAPLCP